jgi:hypothetical protein
MAFTVKKQLAGPGQHRAVLVAMEEVEGRYGPACLWTFRVQGGASDGLELLKTTGMNLRLGSSLADLVGALYGRELREGEALDLAGDLLGRVYEVFAIPRAGGRATVQKVRPIPAS